MFQTKKYKAFTLSELIVVMIVTMLVISITYTVMNLVQSNIKGVSFQLKNNSELRLLEQQLWRDLSTSGFSFVQGENTLICSSPLERSIYDFQSDFILRNQDTLDLQLQSVEYYFDGQKSKHYVDAIKLSFGRDQLNKELFIYTSNDANKYMN